MQLLWPDLGAKAASNNLNRVVHFARKTLGDGQTVTGARYVGLEGELLALCPEGDVWVDVEAFERAASAARRSREPAAYRSALELYLGELLPEDRYEEWAQERRDSLRQLAVTLLVELAARYEERQAYRQAVEALQRAVAEEPVREEAHRGLMRLFALEGRRQQALVQYQRLAGALRRGLHVQPDAATRTLREDIAAGRFPAAAPPLSASIGPPPPAARNHNVTTPASSFVGRLREMAEVKRSLAMTRLLTLTGVGGSGKTRLAGEVARDLVGAYPHGVWLVQLAPLGDAAMVPGAVAAALGVRQPADVSVTDALVEALRLRSALLVLDNCEHLVTACARLVDTLLRSCEHLRVLATSREPLGVPGETLWPVPPLELPPAAWPSTDGLLGVEAVRLFVERARSRMPGFQLTDGNAGAVVNVCRKLEGLPLAIELATARLGSLSVAQIDERLGGALSLLTAGSRTVEQRHQTLRATLDWSRDLLGQAERTLFARLSVFAGGWTLAAAEQVGGAGDGGDSVLDLLGRLVDKSLVLAEASPADAGTLRYRMLEPVRQYGREQLEASGEADAVRWRHADVFTRLAEQAEPELTGPEPRLWLDRLAVELDNLRTALRWSLRGGDPRLGLRCAGALAWFCYLHGHYAEGREWLEEALARNQAAPAPRRAKALTGTGLLSFLQCDYGLAASRLEHGLALYRQVGDDRGVAAALHILGSMAREQGRYPQARRLHEESLALWRSLGDEWGIARSLNYLGFAAWLAQDYDRAAALCADALHRYRQRGDPEGIAWSLISLGVTAQYQGDLERAETLLEESLRLSREAGYREGVAWSLNELGTTARRRGDVERAEALLRESLRLHHDLGDRWRLASVLEGLAGDASVRGEVGRAARLFAAAEALRDAIGTPVPLCERADRDRDMAAARARLGQADWEAATAAGRGMSLTQLVDYALDTRDGRAPSPTGPAAGRLHGDVLTRREREVATLVARGLTDRDIGAALGISKHTVANHVATIKKKLQLSSRSLVAVWVTEERLDGTA